MPKNPLDKVLAVRQDLTQSLLEREAAIEGALLALLCRAHLLLLGPPGTAKSLLVRSICERISGATYFERLLTRFSTPEELFGPLSLSALEQDQYKRISSGTVVESHIAFLDEVFKANSAILNSLLTLINERIFHEAGQSLPVPLLSLFGASNETPEDDSLNALYDRFLLRVTVPYLADDDSMRKLLELQPGKPGTTLSLKELEKAQGEVQQIPLTDDAREAIIAIKHGLEEEGIAVSDRRWRACASLVKAKAYLEGEPQTSSDHAEILIHALWAEPAQIRVVERVVSKVANPLNLEAVELEDAGLDLFSQRPEVDDPDLTSKLEPLLKQLCEIYTRLEQRVQAVPSARALRARQALSNVEGGHNSLSQLALRSLSNLHLAPGA